MRKPTSKDSQPCKVCSATVRRRGIVNRNTYLPSYCEACQKYFRRTLIQKREDKLKCIRGSNDCLVIAGQKFCAKCRFLKCVKSGLKSKLLKATDGNGDDDGEPIDIEFDSDVESLVPTLEQPSSSSLATIPSTGGFSSCRPSIEQAQPTELVVWQKTGSTQMLKMSVENSIIPNPDIFDSPSIEKVFATTLKAYTELIGLECSHTKASTNSTPVESVEKFQQLTNSHLSCGHRVANAFGDMFRFELQTLSTNQIQALTNLRCGQLAVFYWNLPNSKGASFFGISDILSKKIITRFPTLEKTMDLCSALKFYLSTLNPSYHEAAILSAMIYLSGYEGSGNRTLDMMKQSLENACKMKIWQMCKGDLDRFYKRLSGFEQIIALTNQATLEAMVAQTSMVSGPENTMAGLAVQKAFLTSQAQVLLEDIQDT